MPRYTALNDTHQRSAGADHREQSPVGDDEESGEDDDGRGRYGDLKDGANRIRRLPRIGIDEIRSVVIELLPTLADQTRIAVELARHLQAAEALVTCLRKELSTIHALPASLLRAAFYEDS